MSDPAYLFLVCSSYALGLLGSFYLSAQALGFDNIRMLLNRLSHFVVVVVGPTPLDLGPNPENLSPEEIAARFEKAIGWMARFPGCLVAIFNVVLMHCILGIALVIGWALVNSRMDVPVPLLGQVVIGVVLFFLGAWGLGERPHEAVNTVFRIVIDGVRSHIGWVEANTKEGGKTGVLGFALLCVGLTLQFLADLQK